MPDRRSLSWIGQAAKEFRDLPEAVQDAVIFQLGRVQDGKMPDDFKKVQGIKGATVLEIRERYDTNTYRCAYTAQLHHAVYVLTCFMKKSRQGAKADPDDIARIQRRLRVAIDEDADWDEEGRRKRPTHA
ncbi:MAG: type II toxin-antitoxin system RelE/ParE family toxin [Thermomicrobiales bacterium]